MTPFRVDDIGVPEALTQSDAIEVTVTLVPLKYHEVGVESSLRPQDRVGARCWVMRIPGQDHRALRYVVDDLLRNLFARYLGVEF